jgi:hypothetical protein
MKERGYTFLYECVEKEWEISWRVGEVSYFYYQNPGYEEWVVVIPLTKRKA